MRKIKALLAVISALVILTAFVLSITTSPFNYSEMDLNSNGILGLSEVLYFTEHGTKKIEQEGRSCLEYYSLKDGLPLKVLCGEF